MESEKTPGQTPVSTTTDGTVAPPPVEAVSPAAAAEPAPAEATDTAKPAVEPAEPGTDAAHPVAARPNEPGSLPAGFIALGFVVLGVLLLLAFVAYSKQ